MKLLELGGGGAVDNRLNEGEKLDNCTYHIPYTLTGRYQMFKKNPV